MTYLLIFYALTCGLLVIVGLAERSRLVTKYAGRHRVSGPRSGVPVPAGGLRVYALKHWPNDATWVIPRVR